MSFGFAPGHLSDSDGYADRSLRRIDNRLTSARRQLRSLHKVVGPERRRPARSTKLQGSLQPEFPGSYHRSVPAGLNQGLSRTEDGPIPSSLLRRERRELHISHRKSPVERRGPRWTPETASARKVAHTSSPYTPAAGAVSIQPASAAQPSSSSSRAGHRFVTDVRSPHDEERLLDVDNAVASPTVSPIALYSSIRARTSPLHGRVNHAVRAVASDLAALESQVALLHTMVARSASAEAIHQPDDLALARLPCHSRLMARPPSLHRISHGSRSSSRLLRRPSSAKMDDESSLLLSKESQESPLPPPSRRAPLAVPATPPACPGAVAAVETIASLDHVGRLREEVLLEERACAELQRNISDLQGQRNFLRLRCADAKAKPIRKEKEFPRRPRRATKTSEVAVVESPLRQRLSVFLLHEAMLRHSSETAAKHFKDVLDVLQSLDDSPPLPRAVAPAVSAESPLSELAALGLEASPSPSRTPDSTLQAELQPHCIASILNAYFALHRLLQSQRGPTMTGVGASSSPDLAASLQKAVDEIKALISRKASLTAAEHSLLRGVQLAIASFE